jgi:hypothetical protein
MSISFIAPDDSLHTSLLAPAAETFALASADQTAFPRFFPYTLTSFKTGLSANAPGFNMGDQVIRTAAQACIQAALVGGGASIGTATTRASNIIKQTCAKELVIAILADAGA